MSRRPPLQLFGVPIFSAPDIGARASVVGEMSTGLGSSALLHWNLRSRLVNVNGTAPTQFLTSSLDVSFMSIYVPNAAGQVVGVGLSDISLATGGILEVGPGQILRLFTDSFEHAPTGKPLELFDASQFWGLLAIAGSVACWITTAQMDTRIYGG